MALRKALSASVAVLPFLLTLAGGPLAAQSVEDFYRGKQIRLVVGSAAGGGYDAYARTVAGHMAKYIPGNPTFIVQNMDGAGSLVAINHAVNVAAKDGTVIAAIHPDAVLAPLFHPEKAKFDSQKFVWLGSPVSLTYTVTAWHTSPIQSFDEIFSKEFIVAASGGDSLVLPTLANGVLGTKFKIINGYKGASAGMLAIERGEAQGNGGDALNALKSVHSDYLTDGKLRIIAAYGLKPNPDLTGGPMAIDYAKTPEQKEALSLIFANHGLGWPYVMTHETPADRAKAMQTAFAATMKDKDFLAEAAKRKLEISPVSANDQMRLVAATFDTPTKIVAQVKQIIGE
jgi:tripartite-type tricarboxylate transporter receptor subunit TctC